MTTNPTSNSGTETVANSAPVVSLLMSCVNDTGTHLVSNFEVSSEPQLEQFMHEAIYLSGGHHNCSLKINLKKENPDMEKRLAAIKAGLRASWESIPTICRAMKWGKTNLTKWWPHRTGFMASYDIKATIPRKFLRDLEEDLARQSPLGITDNHTCAEWRDITGRTVAAYFHDDRVYIGTKITPVT